MTHVLRTATLCLIFSLGACDLINGATEEDRRIAAAQEVITAYSGAVPNVDQLQRTFVAAWKKANEQKDIKLYKDDLKSNVLPAMNAYVAAADRMPVGSPELLQIHTPLVSAYKRAQATFERFVANLSQENVEETYKAVLEAMEQAKEAEKAYLEKLRAYYKANRVELVKAI